MISVVTFVSLTLSIQPGLAGPPQHNQVHKNSRVDEQSQTVIRVRSPFMQGEFNATTEYIADRDLTRLTLEGKMWDADFTGNGVPSDSWNTKLVFVFMDNESNINSLGSLRTWQVNDTTELYSADPIAPDAALWTKKTSPELGSIEVWSPENKENQVTDSLIVSLFKAMILPQAEGDGGLRGTPCSPTFGECHNAAKNACTHGMASFNYQCDQGAVTCEWACQPNPEPVPE